MTDDVPTPVETAAAPNKCGGAYASDPSPNPCTEPGSLPRCQLCPSSPNYWRKTRP